MGKWGSWALLVSLSFVLVAAVKRWEGTFYGSVGTPPAVTDQADWPGVTGQGTSATVAVGSSTGPQAGTSA